MWRSEEQRRVEGVEKRREGGGEIRKILIEQRKGENKVIHKWKMQIITYKLWTEHVVEVNERTWDEQYCLYNP